jgi:hypothetical protein
MADGRLVQSPAVSLYTLFRCLGTAEEEELESAMCAAGLPQKS